MSFQGDEIKELSRMKGELRQFLGANFGKKLLKIMQDTEDRQDSPVIVATTTATLTENGPPPTGVEGKYRYVYTMEIDKEENETIQPASTRMDWMLPPQNNDSPE